MMKRFLFVQTKRTLFRELPIPALATATSSFKYAAFATTAKGPEPSQKAAAPQVNLSDPPSTPITETTLPGTNLPSTTK